MTTYRIVYSKRSRADLVDIYYGYASLSKKVAKDQVDRIRNEIRSLDTMPERYSIADWEPLQSLKIRRFSALAQTTGLRCGTEFKDANSVQNRLPVSSGSLLLCPRGKDILLKKQLEVKRVDYRIQKSSFYSAKLAKKRRLPPW